MVKPSVQNHQQEHQANERTFLAWLRTSIALIGFGFALARFGIFLRQLQGAVTNQEATAPPIVNSEMLGVSLVIFGIIVIALAARRYNQVYWQIEQRNYQPNRFMIWLTTAVIVILGMLSIPLLLLRGKTPPQRIQQNSSLPQNRDRLIRKYYNQRWL